MIRRLMLAAAVWMGAILGGAGTMLGGAGVMLGGPGAILGGAGAMLGGAGVSPALAQDCGELVQQIPGWGTDFGVSLDIDGDTMVIAALNDIRVFTRVGSDGPWELEAKLDPEDDDNPFGLGRCARIDRERILVQGQFSRAYIFERQGVGTWKRVATMLPPDGEIGSVMGAGLALAGDVAMLAEVKGGGIPVMIHEYQRQEDGSWAYTATLPTPDPPTSTDYARSIDYEDGTLVAGDSIKNRVHVFRRDDDESWMYDQMLEGGDALLAFGISVVLSHGRLLVGASSSFRAATFTRDDAGVFVLEQIVKPSQGGTSRFGDAVALAGDVMAIGAFLEDNPGAQDSGAVYVFVRSPTSGLWEPATRFVAADASPGQWLGRTTAVDETTALGASQPALGSGAVYALDVSACLPEPCPADCNADGALNIFDFLCFQGKVTTGDPEADCNDDGNVNIFDFLCFQGRVTQGCP